MRQDLNRDNPEWHVTLGVLSARYFERVKSTGETQVAVHLVQKDEGGKVLQEMWGDVRRLEKVAKWAQSLVPSLRYRPHGEEAPPEHVKEMDPFTVAVMGRQTQAGEKRVAVILSQQSPGDDGREVRQEFQCRLGRLREFVKEGLEFERCLSQVERKYAVVKDVELTAAEGRGRARVVGPLFDTAAQASDFVDANPKRGLVLWPVPVRSVEKLGEGEHWIDVWHGPSKELNRELGRLAFDHDREGEYFVLGRWNVHGLSPRVGDDVSWDASHGRTFNGEPRDYGVDLGEKNPHEGWPAEERYVLIKRNAKVPFRGEVVRVLENRREAVAEFHRNETVERERDRALSPKLGVGQNMPGGYRPRR